jgi:DNA-binding MarR family transcriptional regulator
MSQLRTANLLGALSVAVGDRLEEELKSHPNQNDSASAALNLIGFYEGCTNGALSAALGLSHTTTVRLLDRLEAQGLVERRPAETDQRAVALYLTRKGRARLREILTTRCAALCDVMASLSVSEERQLGHLLEKILRTLTKTAADADQICRLCDETVCPARTCPVHQAGLALQRAV